MILLTIQASQQQQKDEKNLMHPLNESARMKRSAIGSIVYRLERISTFCGNINYLKTPKKMQYA